ncbi:hypothetical protein SAMN05660772_01023 [Pasteurella testudinis DSM 23072]|uniref:Uncharacterized protein n=1 Tax=Pasteurella testudinis DSM 23072 TaxID=1122938 RepID=A0A1W1V2V2_9PAST|nr:hypothetical protein SAMN05660772_01023 [Pasteurella testudinis DSM 23072]
MGRYRSERKGGLSLRPNRTLYLLIKRLYRTLRFYLSNAIANNVIGCRHCLLVDISICHLQVSQSETI